MSEFILRSNDLVNGEILPNKQVLNAYGAGGENLSPQLSWENVPQGTKSFAIVCHDPDAPKENGWYHWIVVNIPLNITSIKEGEKIDFALETKTDFNTTGYGGACPPIGHGIHHYNFTIFALDIETLNVTKIQAPDDVYKNICSHIIAKSTITAIYERK